MNELTDDWEKKLKDWEEKQKDQEEKLKNFKANNTLIDLEILKAQKGIDRNLITDAELAERERRLALIQIWMFQYTR